MDQEMIWSPSKQNTKILRNLPDSHALHAYQFFTKHHLICITYLICCIMGSNNFDKSYRPLLKVDNLPWPVKFVIKF